MERRSLGASGLQVSRMGLGSMAWGRDAAWPIVKRMVHAFVEAGGNLIDTAPAYGGGVAEKMIGKLLGHSQMQTTQRYAHLMDSPLRAGVDAVASMFRPRPKIVHDADKKTA